MVQVTSNPINPSELYDVIGKHRSGSVVFHYAVVKEATDGDRPTTCIDYRSTGDTEGELTQIAAGLREQWLLEDVLLIRRTGRLYVGDIISLVATSSPNSADAFAACQEGIARLKKMTTIAKDEQRG